MVFLYCDVILEIAVGVGGWLVDGTRFVRYMESNGIKSAFHSEIRLFKAAVNKRHRCRSNDGDFRSKCLMKTFFKSLRLFLWIFLFFTPISLLFISVGPFFFPPTLAWFD